MTAPICSIHGTPMREGKFPGSYFCPKPGDGPKGYCTQKAKAKPESAPTHVSQSPTVKELSDSDRHDVEKSLGWSMGAAPPAVQDLANRISAINQINDARVAAALNFAGRIYQGQANVDLLLLNDANTAEVEKLALNLAERALLMFERKP